MIDLNEPKIDLNEAKAKLHEALFTINFYISGV